MTGVESTDTAQPDLRALSTRAVVALWIIAGIILGAFLGTAPVSRTQEARVLETAREMLGGGADAWLVPHINGRPRLEKPPLCYWMAAGAFQLAGRVNETVGRTPTVLVGWLLLGITYLFAMQLFDQRVGLAAAGAMLGSLIFFRHARLAETDAPAALFVTAAIYALCRARTAGAGWLHLASAATGLAAIAKGMPAGFVLLFLVGWCAQMRSWALLRRFFTTGAFLPGLLIALPWFIYIAQTLGIGVFSDEINTVATGRNHWDWPTTYIPLLFGGVAPWSAVLVMALINAWQYRRDSRIAMLLTWCGAILLPLCIMGNKQGQYLVPLIPPVMILIGWTIISAADRSHRLFGWMRGILIAMLAIAALSEAGILLIGIHQRDRIIPIDAVTGGTIGVVVMIVAMVLARRGVAAAYMAMIGMTALLMPLVYGIWLNALSPITTRAIAEEISSHFGQADYVFFGPNISLPLCFNLRSTIPWAQEPDALPPLVHRGSIVIAQTKSNQTPPPLPQAYRHRLKVTADDQVFDLYEYHPD